VTQASYNSYNFDRMTHYTHAKFIEPFAEKAPYLYDYLRSLLASSPRGTFSDPTHLHKALASIYACILDMWDRQFSWEYAMVQAAVLRSVTKSTFVTDLMSGTYPGSPTAQLLTDKMKKWTEHVICEEVQIDGSSHTLLIVFDNAPGGSKGKYLVRTARGGVEQKKCPSVATAVGGQHIWRPQEVTSIQQQFKHSPKNDRLFDKLSEEEKKAIVTLTPPQQEACERETMALLTERLAIVCEREAHRRSVLGVASVTAGAAVTKVVRCPHCDEAYTIVAAGRKLKCTDG